VTAQSPVHFTSQLEPSAHTTLLPAPRRSLQEAAFEQVAIECAPASSSHLVLATQLITLASPPLPLHSELSMHVSVVGPEESALHLAPVSHRSAQPAGPQVVLQSVPAVQAHSFAVAHAQPAPVQVAARPSSLVEQASVARTRSKQAMGILMSASYEGRATRIRHGT
jgi:hypothetical protein